MLSSNGDKDYSVTLMPVNLCRTGLRLLWARSNLTLTEFNAPAATAV